MHGRNRGFWSNSSIHALPAHGTIQCIIIPRIGFLWITALHSSGNPFVFLGNILTAAINAKNQRHICLALCFCLVNGMDYTRSYVIAGWVHLKPDLENNQAFCNFSSCHIDRITNRCLQHGWRMWKLLLLKIRKNHEKLLLNSVLL